jgi:hypothetical protein
MPMLFTYIMMAICRNVKFQALNLAISAILKVLLAEKYIRSTVSLDGCGIPYPWSRWKRRGR